jgi:hypothetical protein
MSELDPVGFFLTTLLLIMAALARLLGRPPGRHRRKG